MEVFYLIFTILFGLAIGSFINVCIYRIPNEKSIISPPSFCTSCGERIKWYDLIPVISYLILGGKCRNCKEKISIRYPLIEILTAISFVCLYNAFGFNIRSGIIAAIVSVLIMIFFIDLEHMIIPDELNVVLGLLGIALNIIYPPNMIYSSGNYLHLALNLLIGALIGSILFTIFALFGAMGGGDIKLMFALGLIFGWKLMIPLMMLSFIIGGVISIFLLIRKKKGMKDMVPFGPFIVLGTLTTIFYGNDIINWYINNLFINS